MGTPRVSVDLDAPCPTVQTHNRRFTFYELTLPKEGWDMPQATSGKPAYRVPSMSEIAAIEQNGFCVVSTFSGCGGSCLGFKMAGFEVLWANEFIPAARDTYRANHPETLLDTRDIRTVKGSEILAAIGKRVGEIDVLEGSPPCAAFSTAGKREKAWNQTRNYSDTKQRVDDLFFEFARLVEELKPRVFVAENVSGLVKGVAKGYFKEILRTLKGKGYRVEARLLDAQWLGVPQGRQRVIFIGVRNDLDAAPAFPKPLPYRYTVREALPWIKRLRVGGSPDNWQDSDRPSGTIVQSDGARQPGSTAYLSSFEIEADCDITDFAIGKEWDKLKEGGHSDKYFNLQRASMDEPCPTVTKEAGNPSTAGVTHPTERRKFSIAELRRICAFPDDFELTGTFEQQWERLGRAVPPLMMRAIAEVVRDQILSKIVA